LGERLGDNQKVTGSSPVWATKIKALEVIEIYGFEGFSFALPSNRRSQKTGAKLGKIGLKVGSRLGSL
jgi:hypothetical protein